LVGRSVGQREVTQTSRCLFSFVTQARPSRPFYALRATPKTALNFDRSVGRSQGSHTNVTLPLQFCHPGQPFPTLLCPAGHPQNDLKFWSVGRLVGRLVCRLQGSHTNVTLPLQFRLPDLPFPTLLCPAGHPQNSFKFLSVVRLVGRSVTGKSHKRHVASLVSSPGLAVPDPSMPCGPPRKQPSILVGWSVGRSVGRSIGWLAGRSVGRSVTGKSHERHSASSVLSPGPALPDPSTPCRPPPKRP
jgi:hypothetical protein